MKGLIIEINPVETGFIVNAREVSQFDPFEGKRKTYVAKTVSDLVMITSLLAKHNFIEIPESPEEKNYKLEHGETK